MKNKDFELRVMEYFAENINLQKNWEVAQKCARDIINLRFNDILTGNFEIPPPEELKTKVSENVPYEFDSSDFMQNGPVDFSGLEGDMLQDAMKKIQAIYDKFHQAQTKMITKATQNICNRLSENLKNEISNLKKKYLP